MLVKMGQLAKRLLRANPPAPVNRTLLDLLVQRHGLYQGATGELWPGYAIDAADTVIDVGCGGGEACVFAGSRGADVIAVDIDPDRICETQRKMAGTPARSFRAILSDGNPLPLPTASATKVIAQEVLEHVDEPRAFLAELVRVGRLGAAYLITVPDPVGESVQRHVAPPSYWEKPNHLRIFGRDQIDRLVAEAGLRLEKRISYGFYWAMWWILRWSAPGDFAFGAAASPVLEHWNETWKALLESPTGEHVRQALDDFMPKSQVLIARKAA
jgi:SAM-dependent methyltransferase